MAPSRASAVKNAFTNPLPTLADDVKYKKKYKELKAMLNQVEEDNSKLAIKILRSKKAIQRLRVERAILYDRLEQTSAPTNPYAPNPDSTAATAAPVHTSTTAETSTTATATTTTTEAPAFGDRQHEGIAGENPSQPVPNSSASALDDDEDDPAIGTGNRNDGRPVVMTGVESVSG